jgi:methionyl aminopeptidase
MLEPATEQARAGEIASEAINLAKELTRSAYDGLALDKEVETFIRDSGGRPALKGYHPGFADKPYEWTICLAVDNDVVHGVPDKQVDPTQLITVDLVVEYGGWFADTARTFTHSGDSTRQEFVKNSLRIFNTAMDMIGPNLDIGLYGGMVEVASKMCRYGVIKEYCGHGINQAIHTEPQILNYGRSDGSVFQAGNSYAVEPVLSIDKEYVLNDILDDGYSITANCLVSHNEDTIFVSPRGIVNLTGKKYE